MIWALLGFVVIGAVIEGRREKLANDHYTQEHPLY